MRSYLCRINNSARSLRKPLRRPASNIVCATSLPRCSARLWTAGPKQPWMWCSTSGRSQSCIAVHNMKTNHQGGYSSSHNLAGFAWSSSCGVRTHRYCYRHIPDEVSFALHLEHSLSNLLHDICASSQRHLTNDQEGSPRRSWYRTSQLTGWTVQSKICGAERRSGRGGDGLGRPPTATAAAAT